MESYIEKYRKMVSQGICAHSAAIFAINYLYTRAKDNGFSLDEAHEQAKNLMKRIKREWAATGEDV